MSPVCIDIFFRILVGIRSRRRYVWHFLTRNFFSSILSPQVAILDFGSQYSHLIARRVRELHVYCELYSCLVSAEELGKHELVAIILSGGPSSVYDKDAPHVHAGVWKLIEERQIPVLGICYGMQEEKTRQMLLSKGCDRR